MLKRSRIFFVHTLKCPGGGPPVCEGGFAHPPERPVFIYRRFCERFDGWGWEGVAGWREGATKQQLYVLIVLYENIMRWLMTVVAELVGSNCKPWAQILGYVMFYTTRTREGSYIVILLRDVKSFKNLERSCLEVMIKIQGVFNTLIYLKHSSYGFCHFVRSNKRQQV